MNEILLRVRTVFEESGESQTKIGNRIKKTSQYVWKILNDDSANPSDSVLMDISREYSINYDWLKFGTGEMRKSLTRNQEISAFATDLMEEVDESFKKRLILALSKLNERDWETIEKIADALNEE